MPPPPFVFIFYLVNFNFPPHSIIRSSFYPSSVIHSFIHHSKFYTLFFFWFTHPCYLLSLKSTSTTSHSFIHSFIFHHVIHTLHIFSILQCSHPYIIFTQPINLYLPLTHHHPSTPAVTHPSTHSSTPTSPPVSDRSCGLSISTPKLSMVTNLKSFFTLRRG